MKNMKRTKLGEQTEHMEVCGTHFKEIYKAIERFKADKDNIPNWLSDLYPDYLQDESLLICPADPNQGKVERLPFAPSDPKMPCSYLYEFHPKYFFDMGPEEVKKQFGENTKAIIARDYKNKQLQDFGDIVPIVRCWNHGGDSVLSLSYGGKIFVTDGPWEDDFEDIKKQIGNTSFILG
jgi:hypothetical protein